jgi:Putative auto-transporter adhesin, head GIN domain
MKKFFLYFLLVFSVVNTASAQRARSEFGTERHIVADFKNIEINIAADVVIQQADSFSFEIDGKHCALDGLALSVKDSTLRVRKTEWCTFSNPKSTHIVITLPRLERLSLDGAGQVILQGLWKADRLEILTHGAYNVLARQLEANEVVAELSGAGNMELEGKAQKADLVMSGAGNLNAYNLQTTITDCRMSGMGNLECHATEEVYAVMSGMGNLSFTGNPKKITKRKTGLGRIAMY